MDRRRFMKYAGATAAVVGASAIGLDYLLKPPLTNPSEIPTTSSQQTNTQQTSTGVHLPPLIKNLQWTPTRVVNSKVYEGTISFEADADSTPIVEAGLDFDPIYPPEIPTRAIPQETSRSFSYTANSRTATFTQPISDLKGGKRYQAKVMARDEAGYQAKSSADIPYVREFERLDAKDVTVGVQYGTWWDAPTWRKVRPTVTPLLGNYDSSNWAPEYPSVVDRHIDMLTGFGGNAFLSFWTDGYSNQSTLRMFDSPIIEDVAIGLTYHVTWRILGADYGEVNLDTPAIRDQLQSDLTYIAGQYFGRKNYFKLKGMPVVQLYQAGSFSGDVELRMKQIRESLRKESGFDIFLVGDTVKWHGPRRSLVKPYDAITKWSTYYKDEGGGSLFSGGIASNEDNLRRLYKQWSTYSHQMDVHFIPTAMPGFVAVFPPKNNYPILPKTPERFAGQLRVGMDFLDDEVRCLFITTWNDYAENTNIEPTVEEGFKYLQTLRDTLVGH